jgi:hypothetical protein
MVIAANIPALIVHLSPNYATDKRRSHFIILAEVTELFVMERLQLVA